MKYMLEFHNVPHEIAMYVEEVKLFAEIKNYKESFPLFIWVETEWEKDILETIMGVKRVYPKLYEAVPASVALGRNWTELMGTKWEIKPE